MATVAPALRDGRGLKPVVAASIGGTSAERPPSGTGED